MKGKNNILEIKVNHPPRQITSLPANRKSQCAMHFLHCCLFISTQFAAAECSLTSSGVGQTFQGVMRSVKSNSPVIISSPWELETDRSKDVHDRGQPCFMRDRGVGIAQCDEICPVVPLRSHMCSCSYSWTFI